MANPFAQIGESFARMSRREQILVAGLGAALVVLLGSLLAYLTMDGIATREMRNEQLRGVLTRLDKNRARLMASKSQDVRLDRKLDRKPPALQGFIEDLAKRYEIEVKDFKPQPRKELGKKKRVAERAVTVSLHDIALDKLMQLVNAIETSGYVILVTELQITPRYTDHGRLDVPKLRVSAYEHNEPKHKARRRAARATPSRRR